jgi:response regulator NasT
VDGDGRLKVLLADADPGRSRLVERRLETGTLRCVRPRPGEALPDAVARERPDVVIVDMARPDRDALDDIRHITRNDARPVVMFVDGDDPGFMEAAIEAGVSSYNVVGAALPDVKPIVATAVAMFRRHRQTLEKLRRAETELEERQLVQRAKGLLMRRRGVSEPQAYRWLRRQAMNRGRRIAELAVDLLADDRVGGQGDGA